MATDIRKVRAMVERRLEDSSRELRRVTGKRHAKVTLLRVLGDEVRNQRTGKVWYSHRYQVKLEGFSKDVAAMMVAIDVLRKEYGDSIEFV